MQVQKFFDPITYPIDASLASSLHLGRLLTPFAIYRLRNLYRKYLGKMFLVSVKFVFFEKATKFDELFIVYDQ